MATNPQRQKGRMTVVSTLNVAIEGLNLAKAISSTTPAKLVFGSVSVILTMIKVPFLPLYVEGLPANLQSGVHD